MEDFAIDIMLGKESSARSIRLELPHFTLVGATTRAGLLSAPLRDRFGVVQRMEFYTPEAVSYTHLRIFCSKSNPKSIYFKDPAGIWLRYRPVSYTHLAVYQ